MRRKWKKTFAMILALFLTVTSIWSEGIFVSAEETEENQSVENELVVEEPVLTDTEILEEVPAQNTESEQGLFSENKDDTQQDVGEETEEEIHETGKETEKETDGTEEKREEKIEETGQEPEEEKIKETEQETAEEKKEEELKAEETEAEENFTEKQLIWYEPLEQPEGVSVTVSAYEGVLPKGAYMILSELQKGTDDYQKAEKDLEDHEVLFDDFKALDLTFYNADGQMIEPEEGTVQVHMALDAQTFPENADPDTIAVQHHDASCGTVQIEKVADVTAGTVEVQKTEVLAQFDVESFSIFTITWSGIRKEYKLTVKYVDKAGKEIDCTQAKDVNTNMGTTIALTQYAYEINGYTYLGAYRNTVNGEPVTHVKAGWEPDRNGGHYYYQYSDDNKNWKNFQEDTTICLVYDGSMPEMEEVIDTKTLSREKYVTQNADDTYDLTLTVSGAVGSQNHRVKMDVLLIVDQSGSMKSNMSGSGSKTRIEAVADAVKTLTDTLNSNQNLDVMYSVVSFSGPNDWQTKGSDADAWTAMNWSASAENAYETVKNLSPEGGTNYQAGIDQGIEQLKSARSGAQKIVIFLTDGVPTIRNGKKACEEEESAEVGLCNDAAVTAVGGLSANAFYCIGTGSASEENLEKIRDAANVEETGLYLVSDTTALNKAFQEIAAESSAILCDHVTVTDLLSENVEAVMAGTQPQKLLVSIQKEGRNVVEPGRSVIAPQTEQNQGNEASRTIWAVYDAQSRQLSLNFPAEYQLEPDYTYLVTLSIDATEKAYENYRNYGNAYPDRGEPGTGKTSANQSGVFTNQEAQVSYTYKKENKTESYPMPVIQLHPGKLIIEKNIQGLDEDVLPELIKKLTFFCKLNHGDPLEIPFLSFSYDQETGKYTYVLEGLSPDTVYDVLESNAGLEGFDLTQSVQNTSGTIGKDGTATAVFDNAYTVSCRTLTVRKIVSGNMGSDQQEFTFQLTITKNGQSYTGEIDGLTREDDGYSFTLKHGETKKISLPYGCDLTLSEREDHQGYITTCVVDQGEAVKSKSVTVSGLTKDTEVTFTNSKEIKAPTGLSFNPAAFLMMIAVAFVGVCFLWIGHRKGREF